jgi:hypothetical protein
LQNSNHLNHVSNASSVRKTTAGSVCTKVNDERKVVGIAARGEVPAFLSSCAVEVELKARTIDITPGRIGSNGYIDADWFQRIY